MLLVSNKKVFNLPKDQVAGNIIFPRLNCINNNGSAEWESDARNACV